MKQIICILFCFLFLISMCACGKNIDDFDKPASFYYVAQPIENEVFKPEIREVGNYQNNALQILNTYLKGPESDDLVSPFPTGCEVTSLDWEDNTLCITVNDAFASLVGIDLSIACTAVSMTLTELTGCDSVAICAEKGQLDGSSNIILTSEDIYTLDKAVPDV